MFKIAGDSIYVIAEIGVNHQGSTKIARDLIRTVKECGADAVKFQKRDLNSLYVKDYITSTEKYEKHYQYLLPIIKKVELPKSFYFQAKELCDDLGLDMIVTPFDIESLHFVKKLSIPVVK